MNENNETLDNLYESAKRIGYNHALMKCLNIIIKYASIYKADATASALLIRIGHEITELKNDDVD